LRAWLAVPIVFLVAAPTALAATFSFSVSTASPVTPPVVTLSGDDQTKSFTIVTLVSYTGNRNTAGWSVEAKATTPKSGKLTLPALEVTNGVAACSSGCTSAPENLIDYPLTLTTSAQTVFDADAGSGRGAYLVTSTYRLTYPANAIAGTYSSTVTLTGSTGP
jgi:hypothetical protein